MDYEIKCYSKFSWGYVYMIDGKRMEIWADNVEDLKRKVLARNLPWDESMVPEAKPVKVTGTCVGLIEHDESPASFRLPWCKSNYKRY